jgi:hypothetical protein
MTMQKYTKVINNTTGKVHLSEDCGISSFCGQFLLDKDSEEVDGRGPKCTCKNCLYSLQIRLAEDAYDKARMKRNAARFEPFDEQRHSFIPRHRTAVVAEG